MEFDTQLIHSLLWFLGGSLTYKFLHNIVNLGQLTLVFEELNKRIILLAYHMDADMDFLCKKKYEHLRESGMKPAEINFVKAIDNRTLKTWRETVIHQFFAAYPRQMHRLLPFNDWASAQRYAIDSFGKENRE
jgi:hypothetical protein